MKPLLVPALLTCLVACGSSGDGRGEVELVGHADLGGRGMNSALAIIGDHVYIGSRTDGVTHDDAGVMIVDASDPANPRVVGQIERPNQGLLGISSRELRAIPERNLLLVLNFSCSLDLHDCRTSSASYPSTGGAEETDNIKFYDVSDPVDPTLVATYDFGSHPLRGTVSPHEMFLWRDPANPARTLLYVATPLGPPSLQVIDISNLDDMKVIATFNPEVDAGLDEPRGPLTLLHSVGLNRAGDVAYISHEAAGLLIADTSELAQGLPEPTIRLLTPQQNRVNWSPPNPAGTHSAVEIPGRALAVVTDEIYAAPNFPGCPWGWMRIIDYANPNAPFIAGEYKLAENDPSICVGEGGPNFVNVTAHNTTTTENLALITWHAGGLRIVDTSDPTAPTQLAGFIPQPLPEVVTEDPSMYGNPVAMWSYPVVKDGLVYVVNIRNGLYILRYRGPHAGELEVPFLEGNSNLR